MDELQQAQNDGLVPGLSSLVMACRRRYLDAARLLEVDENNLSRVRELALQPVDLSLLAVAYREICKRYRDELHSPQGELWEPSHQDRIMKAWNEFYYCRFVPTVLWEDEFVRNVLRCVGALSANDQHGPATSLQLYITEMYLPHDRPLADETRRVDT